MATVGSAIVCDRLRLYGNSSLCDRLRSFAIIWKPAFRELCHRNAPEKVSGPSRNGAQNLEVDDMSYTVWKSNFQSCSLGPL